MMDNCREHIKKIREDFQASQRVKNSLNNSIKTLARDLYAKDTHFIFELIQNAEDNTYHEVEPSLSFLLSKTDPTGTHGSEGALIIRNNEIGFSPENVEAICAVGETTKSKSQGYIGEKGIGFKSVFKVTSNPHIFSNGYSFCFPEREKETGLGYIVPIWIETLPDSLCRSKTTIILPLKPDFGYSKIEEMLHDIEPETILFLSKIKKIIIETDIGDNLTILKDDSKKPLVKILVEGNRQGNFFSALYEFLLCKSQFNKPKDIKQENREEIETREVSIAFPVKKNQKDIGKIFAYLPVRADTGLPFLINADFILPSSREDIQDIPWNRWLLRCVAELMGEALPLLKKRGLLRVDFLEMLASRLNELAEDKKNMFYPIVEAVRDALMNDELLPADDETFVAARNAKLARGEWIRKLLRDKQLKILFESKAPLKWIAGEVTESGKYSNLWKYIREILKVEEVTPETFARQVDLHFFKKQTDKWFIEFYGQLTDQKALWREGFSTKLINMPPGPLRSKPFIRLQNGGHVEPFRDDGLPNAYRPPSGETSFPIVKRSIAKDEQALSFLKELGLSEPNNVFEVIKHVIPKYLSSSTPVPYKEHKHDIMKIQQALKDPQEDKQRLMQALQETPFILARNPVSGLTFYRRPDDGLYFSNDTLEMYFAGNTEVEFVSSNYPKPTLDMFKELEVSEDVRVWKNMPNHQGFVIKKDWRNNHERGLNGFDPEIQVEGLEHALASPSLEKSVFIWNRICIPNAECIGGTIEKSFKKNYEDSKKEESISEFGRLLMDSHWLPNPSGGFSKPKTLFLNDLPTEFEKDTQRAEALSRILHMKQPEREKALEVVTGRDDDFKRLIEHYQSASESERKKILKIIPREIPPEPAPSFKDALKNLGRLQRGEIEPGDQEISPVSDPDRYQKKLDERTKKGIEEYHSTPRKITFSPLRDVPSNAEARRFLYDQYCGHCQVTGTTFPKASRNADGVAENYFEACSILSYANADYLNDAGNMLCLCADTMAKLKYASVEFLESLEDVIETFKVNGEQAESISVKIRLAGEECSIKWNQRHFMHLVALYEKA